MARVVTFSGSIRTGSLNAQLIAATNDVLTDLGHVPDAVNLGNFPLPIYDGDDEARDGVPATAHALAERIAVADAVLISSPEYNGGPSGLLKNSIDWVTRSDRDAFKSKPVGLLGASPGSRGAMHGLEVLTSLFTWMRCDVADKPFSLPTAGDALADGKLPAEDRDRLVSWLAELGLGPI